MVVVAACPNPGTAAHFTACVPLRYGPECSGECACQPFEDCDDGVTGSGACSCSFGCAAPHPPSESCVVRLKHGVLRRVLSCGCVQTRSGLRDSEPAGATTCRATATMPHRVGWERALPPRRVGLRADLGQASARYRDEPRASSRCERELGAGAPDATARCAAAAGGSGLCRRGAARA